MIISIKLFDTWKVSIIIESFLEVILVHKAFEISTSSVSEVFSIKLG